MNISKLLRTVKFELSASGDSPFVNPAFVIHDWHGDNVEIKINGRILPNDKNVRTGYVDTPEGKDLVVWLNKSLFSQVAVEFNSR